MVLVVIEATKGKIKKSALEAVTYGSALAKQGGNSCSVLLLGPCDDADSIGTYGASQVYHANHLMHFDDQLVSQCIIQSAEKCQTKDIIFPMTAQGKALAGKCAVLTQSALIMGAVNLPDQGMIRKNVFAGKAFCDLSVEGKRVIVLQTNSLPPQQTGGTAQVETIQITGTPSVHVLEEKRVEGRVPLPEAELVVSGGRGLKGPENWHLIEDLATVLGATTACSRPVADAGWRPHHEHVGQTGIAIRPNLYIACGISGAIQHLAGVNKSKTIVVINQDPEAPFFKAADYGVVGDVFEVLPKLTDAIRRFKV